MLITSLVFAYFGITLLFEDPNALMRYWEIPGPRWPGSGYFFFRWCGFMLALLAIGPWFCGIDDSAMCKMWLVHNIGFTGWTLYAGLNHALSLAKESWMYVGFCLFVPLTLLNAVVVYWIYKDERRVFLLGASPKASSSPYLRGRM